MPESLLDVFYCGAGVLLIGMMALFARAIDHL